MLLKKVLQRGKCNKFFGHVSAGFETCNIRENTHGKIFVCIKNAQDGISMIQTYEGALTETDSILQRMKTLADQAANGTYQDDVDRDAIQLEFDQLNDELNQIADTDFNGVVVLNGGQMADGTKAINGKFDYENGTRDSKTLGSSDINQLDYQLFDDTDTTNGLTVADTAWKDLFGSDRTDNLTDNDGPDSFDLTLTYNSALNQWSVDKATNGADTTKLTINTTDNGGFTVDTANATGIANVTLAKSDLVNGDKITIRFNNPAAGTAKPSNFNATQLDASNLTAKSTSAEIKAKEDANLTFTGPAAAATMTEDVNKLYEALNGAIATATYTDKATAVGDLTLKLADGQEISKSKNTTALTIGDTTFTVDYTTAGTIEITDGTNSLFKVEMTAQAAEATKGDNTTGSVTFKITLDESNYDASTKPSAEIVDSDSKVSKANAFDQANAPLTYTDHITLQSGARTKDAVDFTFKYSSGGLGDLKANMNCSSREDGLGTASLSLKDQKSANYAIDRIDNAINKVSMVRAT
ncbi:MAG: hypothetical protein K2N72_13890, partial [Oscillospiraceae bacterium]|nr:hypothetical protein [Oscillospiraceae bacterium]